LPRLCLIYNTPSTYTTYYNSNTTINSNILALEGNMLGFILNKLTYVRKGLLFNKLHKCIFIHYTGVTYPLS